MCRARRNLRLGVSVLLTLASSALRAQTPPCPPIDTTAAWVRLNKAWSAEKGVSWANDSLRRVLLALADRDQAARQDFGAHASDTAYGRRLNATDSVLAGRLEKILARFGLPTRSMVGPKGSDAAMLVVQHNERLQERVLALARALPPGQISPQALAMLEDRVLVHQGKAQRYGTQFSNGPDGVFRLDPTDDLPGLAARREKAGLPPLPQYACLLEAAGVKLERSSFPPE